MKRLAASLAIAGRDRGFSDKERADVVLDAASGYRAEMAKLATMRDLDVWYARMDIEKVLADLGDELGLTGRRSRDKPLSKAKVQAEKALAKARTRNSMQALDKLTEVVDGETRFVSDPPLLVPIEEPRLRGPEQGPDRNDARAAPQLPAHPPERPAAPPEPVPVRRASPARWSGSGASAPGPGSS